jgi:hypothetical protein
MSTSVTELARQMYLIRISTAGKREQTRDGHRQRKTIVLHGSMLIHLPNITH